MTSGLIALAIGIAGLMAEASFAKSPRWLHIAFLQFLYLAIAIFLQFMHLGAIWMVKGFPFITPKQTALFPTTLLGLCYGGYLLMVEMYAVPALVFSWASLNLIFMQALSTYLERLLGLGLLLSFLYSVLRLIVKLYAVKLAYQFRAQDLEEVMKKLVVILKLSQSKSFGDLTEENIDNCRLLLKQIEEQPSEREQPYIDVTVRILCLIQASLELLLTKICTPAKEIHKRLLASQLGDEEATTNTVNIFKYASLVGRKEAKEAIKLFRPCPNGDISALDFIEKVESVYKDLDLIMQQTESVSHLVFQHQNMMYFTFGAVAVIAVASLLFVPTIIALVIGSVLGACALSIPEHWMGFYCKDALTIIERQTLRIGEVVKIDSSDPLFSSKSKSKLWLVKTFDFKHTNLVNLGDQSIKNCPNNVLANCSTENMSHDKANYRILFKARVGDIGVEAFKALIEKICDYAIQTSEWKPVNTFINENPVDTIDAQGFAEYHIELQ
ncbi:hypothetical protein FisN_14Lu213 [Fistulifera solaris]|uniref:Uncharacterized protein n=1 Tax=Fistulifera solaris TaxID=1519565 RepID=A0A1Z5J9N0_FISSO|nr:hypothetical protein FisN_14Lu213 [Fistulifera solaris]|eukprot:GAX10695.1 hypothetical protein FisN_14Lu213 [Fistulifera solaris]